MEPFRQNNPLEIIASFFVCRRDKTCEQVQLKLDKMLEKTAFKVGVVELADGAKWQIELTYGSFSKKNLSILVMHHGKSISLSFDTDDDQKNLKSLTPFKVSKLVFDIKEQADWEFTVYDIKSKNALDLKALAEALTKLEKVLNLAFKLDTSNQQGKKSTIKRDALAEQREAFRKEIEERGIDGAIKDLGGIRGLIKFIDETRQE